MTISGIDPSDWLDSMIDPDLEERRRVAEQRKAKAEQVLARLSVDARKIDTRRKIVTGGAVVAAARRNPEIRALLYHILDAELAAPRDRALLGLAPRPPAATET